MNRRKIIPFLLLTLGLAGITLQAQDLEVKGIVKDALTGESLIGVNVLIKGTNSGTTTDIDGSFILEASLPVNLVFSYIGYRPQELLVQDRKRFGNFDGTRDCRS